MISIIVPIYNVEQYLPECIESILKQTYVDYEIILIDDGSTDKSGTICDNYSHNKKIKIIHQNNKGLSAARNAGLSVAVGDYVCFIDSDDWVDNNFIEHFIQLMNEHCADIISCEFNIVSENKKSKTFEKTKIKITDKLDSIRLLIEQQEKCSACAKLFKRSLFDDIVFPEGKLYEDLSVMHKIFLKTDKIIWSSLKLYNYRMRNSSIIHQSFTLKLLDKVIALKGRYSDLSELVWIPESIKREAYIKYIEGAALACCDMNYSGYKKTDIYREYMNIVKNISFNQIIIGRLSKSGLLSCILIKCNEKLFDLYINVRFKSRR